MSNWFDIPLIRAAYLEEISMISYLLDQGIDINIQDRDGYNALLIASLYGHENVVSYLIERGADISRSNNVRIIVKESLSYQFSLDGLLLFWPLQMGERELCLF